MDLFFYFYATLVISRRLWVICCSDLP